MATIRINDETHTVRFDLRGHGELVVTRELVELRHDGRPSEYALDLVREFLADADEFPEDFMVDEYGVLLPLAEDDEDGDSEEPLPFSLVWLGVNDRARAVVDDWEDRVRRMG